MNKKIGFLIFGLIVLAIPIYLMISSENILENGFQHKIRLEGRDPFDPFRGKYLRINIDNSVECEGCAVGDEVFVILQKGENGFSSFSKGLNEKPSNSDYFSAKVESVRGERAFLKLDNLSKYFINEDKVKEAEKVVIAYQRQQPNDIYLAIRVLDGDVRLEDIFIEDTPLLEFIEKK